MNDLLNTHTKEHKLLNTSKALTEVLCIRKDDEVGVRRCFGEIYRRGKIHSHLSSHLTFFSFLYMTDQN